MTTAEIKKQHIISRNMLITRLYVYDLQTVDQISDYLSINQDKVRNVLNEISLKLESPKVT